jgi:hypothetical protein
MGLLHTGIKNFFYQAASPAAEFIASLLASPPFLA